MHQPQEVIFVNLAVAVDVRCLGKHLAQLVVVARTVSIVGLKQQLEKTAFVNNPSFFGRLFDRLRHRMRGAKRRRKSRGTTISAMRAIECSGCHQRNSVGRVEHPARAAACQRKQPSYPCTSHSTRFDWFDPQLCFILQVGEQPTVTISRADCSEM